MEEGLIRRRCDDARCVIVSAVLLWQKATSERPLWFSVIPPDANFSSRPTLAISPDGKHIVFGVEGASGSISLWIRGACLPRS